MVVGKVVGLGVGAWSLPSGEIEGKGGWRRGWGLDVDGEGRGDLEFVLVLLQPSLI